MNVSFLNHTGTLLFSVRKLLFFLLPRPPRYAIIKERLHSGEYSGMDRLKARLHTYFIDAMGAMAQGLFASLLIGTIFKTIGQYCHLAFLVELAGIASGAA